MRILAAVGVALAAVGCGGGMTKEDAQTMRQELLAHDAQIEAKLRTDLTATETKFARVLQIEAEVSKKLDELSKLQSNVAEMSKTLQVKIDLANTNVVKVLEFEERLLTERLASIRGMLEELKKK